MNDDIKLICIECNCETMISIDSLKKTDGKWMCSKCEKINIAEKSEIISKTMNRMTFECHTCGKDFGFISDTTAIFTGSPCPICGSQHTIVRPDIMPDISDAVNHPSHYADVVPGIECIDVTKHFQFCRGNAIKYLWRAGNKDKAKTIEDLRKAIWYIQKEIDDMENIIK